MDHRFGVDSTRDGLLVFCRILMMILFLLSGWAKLNGFAGTVAHFASTNVPEPTLAAVIAVLMELFAGIAIVLGVLTRPLAVLLAIYTLATALLGHKFWVLTGAPRAANEINFLKNISIIGGFFLLYLTGAGRYSVDARIGLE